MNDNFPPSLNQFAGELEQAIRRELGARRGHRLFRLPGARPRLLAGTTIGATATGALLAIVLSAAGSSPAFAVTRNRDGSYTVTLRSLSAIPAANRKLSQMGLHATLVETAANCRQSSHPVRTPVPIPLHFRLPPPPRPLRRPPDSCARLPPPLRRTSGSRCAVIHLSTTATHEAPPRPIAARRRLRHAATAKQRASSPGSGRIVASQGSSNQPRCGSRYRFAQ